MKYCRSPSLSYLIHSTFLVPSLIPYQIVRSCRLLSSWADREKGLREFVHESEKVSGDPEFVRINDLSCVKIAWFDKNYPTQVARPF
jgi:hypothetical protein